MKQFLRQWKELDLGDIEKHLVVMGELSGECFSCRKVGIDVKAKACPNCGVNFKYMGFRRKVTSAYIRKMKQEFSGITLIDFDDFKNLLNKREARKLLGI